MYIVPFAGIAYLWHIGATRTLIESLPGSSSGLPRWLQLASGVLFVCMLFAGTAAVGAVALLTVFSSTPLPSPEVARTLTGAGYGMVFVFGVRAAGMYMITTTTLARRRGLLPRWVAAVSYLGATFLLVSTTFHPATLLVFPGWVLLLSVVLLVVAGRPGAVPAPARSDSSTTHSTDPRPEDTAMSMTIDLDDIPGPSGLPLVGNAFDIDADNPIEGFMAMAEKYGPIFKLSVPGGTRLIVSGPDLVEEICDDARFDKRVGGGLAALRKGAADTGLFTAETDDPLWHRAHNILMSPFSLQAMRDYMPRMVDIADQLMDKWDRLNEGDEVDVPDDMTRLTLDTIALCGFGYRFNSFYRDTPHPFVQAMVRTLSESQARARQLPIQTRLKIRAQRQVEEDQAFMDDLVDRLIAERRAQGDAGDTTDLLGRMLTGVDRQTGERLPDANIRAQCITFLIAGHETTSGLLSFALYYLLKNPAFLERARAEVDEVLGDTASPTFEQVHRLTYVRQVLDESLRLWPTAPGFSRYPFQDTVIGGRYAIPANTTITVLTPALHRATSVWGPDAAEFNPEHMAPERLAAVPPAVYKPFGTGQRACIGRQFALQEAALVLGMLLQRFDLDRPPRLPAGHEDHAHRQARRLPDPGTAAARRARQARRARRARAGPRHVVGAPHRHRRRPCWCPGTGPG